ncbi:MAG: DUF3795 domain-containing protein [Bacteroidales bacterium]|jgi:hypothetical protein|nr:DUF3795 domain-containing protein [Bacteroidales bacterium]
MKNLIACCGIDCEFCDARIATVNNDNKLREKTAKQWREMYNAPSITTESINCMGCRIDGAKIAHCYECEIIKCVKTKGFNTCGECQELETCQIVGFVLQHVPGAKENLLS